MYTRFDEKSQQALQLAKKEMISLKSTYISSEHLLLAILKSSNRVSKKLNEIGVNYDNFKNKIIELIGKGNKKSEWFLYTPLLKRIIENTSAKCKNENDGIVTIEYLFSSLVDEGEGVAIRTLISLDIDLDKLEKIAKELKMESKFNKNDLKERYLLVTRNGKQHMISNHAVKRIDKNGKFEEGKYINLKNYNDDLTDKNKKEWDIVEVLKPLYESIWKREEEPTPKKMTVAEIQKELGYKVEIVE